ncbi:putative MutT/NUDIX-family protein [Microbacterium sorbitolivorans]|uniref:NUDIX domain-containing protein n=1 Tax=Microbacterium sorbitolivorans TaxID=1867410 RepID=A0A367Y810_9MICO|nr:NUDIX domain-containing protein [Microbacterium sorbitolivorans]RCK61995.1 NUDIX domain-containing protein [Microbacterium sorbitolivorans]GGF44006.1 putative MutT/NUDIX-family protein [Microbacterium sorbitolivorans]
MATPDFILRLREKIGHDLLWLTGVTAVVVKDDAVLLVERADNGRITPVTGIVDPGEEPAVAAEREVLEEAGLVAETEALVWVHSMAPQEFMNGDKAQFMDIVLRCRYVSGEPHPADGENARAWWCPIDELDTAGLAGDMLERIHTALGHEGTARFAR